MDVDKKGKPLAIRQGHPYPALHPPGHRPMSHSQPIHCNINSDSLEIDTVVLLMHINILVKFLMRSMFYPRNLIKYELNACLLLSCIVSIILALHTSFYSLSYCKLGCTQIGGLSVWKSHKTGGVIPLLSLQDHSAAISSVLLLLYLQNSAPYCLYCA